jgi:hypothetical protein
LDTSHEAISYDLTSVHPIPCPHCRCCCCSQVQFGADSNAARAFASLCSSLPTLLSACPELTAALVVQNSVTAGMTVQGGDAAAVKPAAVVTAVTETGAPTAAAPRVTAVTEVGGPAAAEAEGRVGVGLSDPMLLAARAACLQLYRVAAVTVTDVLSRAVLVQHGRQQLPTAATGAASSLTAVDTSNLAAVDSRYQDLAAMDARENKTASGNYAAGCLSAGDTNDLAAVDGRCQGLAAVDTTDLTAVDASDSSLAAVDSRHQELAAVGTRDLSASAVIQLPYAHYSLVGEDGRPLERPDKHPFALSRVMYDARCVVVWRAAAGCVPVTQCCVVGCVGSVR